MTATAAKAIVTALRTSTGYRQLTWDNFQPVITTGRTCSFRSSPSEIIRLTIGDQFLDMPSTADDGELPGLVIDASQHSELGEPAKLVSQSARSQLDVGRLIGQQDLYSTARIDPGCTLPSTDNGPAPGRCNCKPFDGYNTLEINVAGKTAQTEPVGASAQGTRAPTLGESDTGTNWPRSASMPLVRTDEPPPDTRRRASSSTH